MYKRLFTLLAVFFILTKTYGQKMEKVFLDRTDTTRNCYTIIYPASLPWKGYLFLVPGFGETAERVLEQTSLPIEAAKNGILVIIPTFQDGVLSFGVDSLSQQSFSSIIKDVTSKHKLQDLDFYIGGFSIGGSAAIKYAETADKKPKAVFAIDPPLDFERFYYAASRDIRLSVMKQPNPENVYMVGRIEQVMGGTPQAALKNYYKTSPYSFTDTSQSAIKGLMHLPLRIYAEPDIQWWLKERNTDVTSMNITDCSAMINELNRLGNNNAVLMITQNKGYRKPNNQRHPHSWSIVDNNELIKWLLKR